MKIFRDFSIKNKLVVIVLTVALLAIAIGFTFVIVNSIKTFTEDLVSNTSIIADYTADACLAPMQFEMMDEIDTVFKSLHRVNYVDGACIFNDEKALVRSWERDKTKKFTPPEIIDFGRKSVFEDGYLKVYFPIMQNNNPIGLVYIRASRAMLDKKINNYIRTMILVLIGLILITYVLAIRFQRVISGPILNLATVTRDITDKTDYSVRVEKQGNDEIGYLYTGFNKMLDAIQERESQRDEAMGEQKRLMGELEEKNKELEQVVYVTSHDLRSPLVNIQGFSKELDYSIKELGDLLKTEDLPGELKEKFNLILEEDIPDSLKYILSSTSKMDALLSGLLKLSRVGRTATTMGNVDMNELLSEISNAFEFHFKEGSVSFNVGDLPPCYGNDVQLNQMFSNLVGNALKYQDSERTCKINVAAEEDDEHIIYTVEDNGQGIAKEHQKKIFEIFHRLNPSDTQGEGLGLTIVNKIVGRHNGKIWVESEPGEGSKFFVKLPKAKKKLKRNKKK